MPRPQWTRWLLAPTLLAAAGLNAASAQKPPDLPIRPRITCIPSGQEKGLTEEHYRTPMFFFGLDTPGFFCPEVGTTVLIPFELLPFPATEEAAPARSASEESEPKPTPVPLQDLLYHSEPIAVMPREVMPPAPVALSQVLLNVLVAEVDDVAIKGKRRASERLSSRKSTSVAVVEGNAYDTLLAELKRLTKKGRAQVICRPQIMTLSGQKAVYFVGQEGPNHEEVGVRLGVLPTVVHASKLRLELDLERSALAPELGVADSQRTIPGRKAARVNSTAELELGRTLILLLPGLEAGRSTVLLLRPELASSPQTSDLSNDPNRRMTELLNQSEDLKQIEYEWERIWSEVRSSAPTPRRNDERHPR